MAPGLCWPDRDDLAVASIRKLKALAREAGSELWPNHDVAFCRSLRRGGVFVACGFTSAGLTA